MAWFEIKYNCGHTGREQIYGKTADREKKAIWLGQNKVCPDCYEKNLVAKRAAANEAAKKAAETQGLPALTGSKKQVAWAETIRQEKIARINELIRVIEIAHNPNGIEKSVLYDIATEYEDFLLRFCRDNYQAVMDNCQSRLSRYTTWTEAKKFIDNRAELELYNIYQAAAKK